MVNPGRFSGVSFSGAFFPAISGDQLPIKQEPEAQLSCPEIVRPDENHRLAQFDLDVLKAFEVLNSQNSLAL